MRNENVREDFRYDVFLCCNSADHTPVPHTLTDSKSLRADKRFVSIVTIIVIIIIIFIVVLIISVIIITIVVIIVVVVIIRIIFVFIRR